MAYLKFIGILQERHEKLRLKNRTRPTLAPCHRGFHHPMASHAQRGQAREQYHSDIKCMPIKLRRGLYSVVRRNARGTSMVKF
jgi:hypothetical protein